MTALAAYTEGLESALVRIVADMQARAELAQARGEAAIAALQTRAAEAETRHVALEAQLRDMVDARLAAVRNGDDVDMDVVNQRLDEAIAALPVPKNADPVDMAEVERLIGEYVAGAVASLPSAEPPELPDVVPIVAAAVETAVAALPPPQPGKSADPAEIDDLWAAVNALREAPGPDLSNFASKDQFEILAVDGRIRDEEVLRMVERLEAMPGVIAELVAEAVDAIPRPEPGKPGKDADPVEIAGMIAAALPPIEELRGPPGAPGRLPVAEPWIDRVYYEGEPATHRGATWQARRDTGREPPHADWTCLAARGSDGRGFRVRGTWDPEADDYEAGDIAIRNYSSFVALRDDPGDCPGDGWQLWAGRGQPGEKSRQPGPQGLQGLKGKDAAGLVAATVDDEGVLTLTLSDGTEHRADFYPVLAKVAR